MENNISMTTTSATSNAVAEDSLTGGQKADIAFRGLIFIGGIIGNLLVIFVILFLNEFQKLTHWYVLQLALADFLFLLTLPFRMTEIIHGKWIYPVSLCQARQTILFFNYYASILFLMIMAIDRYLAVCHALSTRVQRMRSRLYSYIVTAITWAVALTLCIPVMMYSDTVGVEPNCICTLDFPKDKMQWCIKYMGESAQDCYDSTFDEIHGASCTPALTGESSGGLDFGSGSGDIFDLNFGSGFGGFSGFGDVDFGETVTATTVDGSQVELQILHSGCYYNPEKVGWHVFIYFNFVVMFVVPLIVISTCYTLIVVRLMSTNVADRRGSNSEPSQSVKGSTRRLWKSGRRRSSSASTGNTYREKMKVTVMCAALVLLFIFCWLPFHSVHLAKIVGIETTESGASLCARLGSATSILAYLNSALNPYLYNFLGTFQKRMRQIKNHKRMQSILSATGLTRIAGRSSSTVHSSDSSRDRKRSSVPNESRSGSIPNEKIALRTIEDKTTTTY